MKDILLIVDDEADLLSGLKRSISQELECTVLTATDGKEAMRVIRNEPVDVALTDINMPGMDGLTLLKNIVEHDPALSVIMMTAYGT
ncbi:MAG: response regulator, partial [Deltaproteobacteria bacterium]|nr:response regulator [Deltaproteobacteria bacterium]MBT7153331.1 response regulator [Deltaproteobacteria bacterium]